MPVYCKKSGKTLASHSGELEASYHQVLVHSKQDTLVVGLFGVHAVRMMLYDNTLCMCVKTCHYVACVQEKAVMADLTSTEAAKNLALTRLQMYHEDATCALQVLKPAPKQKASKNKGKGSKDADAEKTG